MSRARHVPFATLFVVAGAGVQLGHSLGYGAAALVGATTGVGHGHLDVLGDILVPLGAVGVLVAILLDPRRPSLPRPWAGWRLASVQSGMYLALEAGERQAQGHGLEGLLTAPVLAGFGAQLVVALLVTRLVRAARRSLAPLVDAPALLPGASVVPCPAGAPWVIVGGRDRRPVGSRAPPASRALVAPR